MRTIAQEVERLDQLSVPDLVSRYVEVYGRPPRSKHRRYLEKRIAFKVAEARSGGLSEVARRRLDELMREIDLPAASPETATGFVGRQSRPGALAVGTTLVREWRGTKVAVTVVEGGFEWNGKVHRSLSAVAKAVTSTHWNGNLFFGITKRRSAK